MIAAVHQPQYLAWLGYFDKMDQAEVFCFLDSVQFKKNEFQNRNRVKTAQGPRWLTVPVEHHFGQTILETPVNNQTKWAKKQLGTLENSYGKSPFFDEYYPKIAAILSRPWENLCELNVELAMAMAKWLGIRVSFVRSSEMDLPDGPSLRLAAICRQLEARTYLAGASGKNYMDMEPFAREGVEVVFQEYDHPRYSQLYGDFVSHLSALDLLFNHGPDSLNILRRGRRPCSSRGE